MPLTRMFLCSRVWKFARADGSILAEAIRLQRDGTIHGYSHPNEARWEMVGGQCVFCREDGVATTRFGIDHFPSPTRLRGRFLFDESITHTLVEVGRVELPQRAELPPLSLVRPSLGHPSLLSPSDLADFEVVFAGTGNGPDAVTREAWVNGQMVIQLEQKGLLAARAIPTTVAGLLRYSDSDTEDPPLTSRAHQHRAGYRWELPMRARLERADIERLAEAGWPQLFDVAWQIEGSPRRRSHHALFVSEMQEKPTLSFLHVTDTHVARRNDVIPEVLAESRQRNEARYLRLAYNNFNDNLRAVIRFANQEQVDFVVITGDVIDYFHDGVLEVGPQSWYGDYVAGERGERGGWLSQPPQTDSNISKLREIVTGSDGRSEPLRCPLFCVPGNHEYLRMEPPLLAEVDVYFAMLRVREKMGMCPDKFGLVEQAATEFEFWKKTPGDSYPERCRRKREGPPFPTPEFDAGRFLWFGTPTWDDLGQYLTEISYDTDYVVDVGRHRLVFLNSGEDVCLPKAANLINPETWFWKDCEKHYIDDQSHNRGIIPAHLELLYGAVQESAASGGLTLLFLHAPLVREREPADEWPGDTTGFEGWDPPDKDCDDGSFHRTALSNRNAIPGLDGCTCRWSSDCAGSMIQWLESGAGGVDAIFCGHSHDSKEYRFGHGTQVSTGNYSQALGATPGGQKRSWLEEYRPIQFITSSLKGPTRSCRHVVVDGEHLRTVDLRDVAPYLAADTSLLCYLFSVLSIDLARFGGYDNPARNDLNPGVHVQWARNAANRHMIVWDLMEKFELQLRSIEHLDAIVQDQGYLVQLRDRVDHVDGTLLRAGKPFAMIVGEDPDTTWWYNPQDPGLPYGRRRNQFFAICAACTSIFGVDLGSSQKMSLDLRTPYAWCQRERRTRLEDSLEERVAKLFEFAAEGRGHLLAMWYASESVHLAASATWESLGRASREPQLHLNWALEQDAKPVLAELTAKIRMASADIFQTAHAEGVREFYIAQGIRMAGWGTSAGTLDEQPSDEFFEREAVRLRSEAADTQDWAALMTDDACQRAVRVGQALFGP